MVGKELECEFSPCPHLEKFLQLTLLHLRNKIRSCNLLRVFIQEILISTQIDYNGPWT